VSAVTSEASGVAPADDELLVMSEAFEDEGDVVDRLKPAAEAELHNGVGGILLR
jgi:hypothetical protein